MQSRIREVLQEKMEDEDSYSNDDGDIAEEEILHALKEKGACVIDICWVIIRQIACILHSLQVFSIVLNED